MATQVTGGGPRRSKLMGHVEAWHVFEVMVPPGTPFASALVGTCLAPCHMKIRKEASDKDAGTP